MWSLLLVVAANVFVFWSLASDAAAGRITLAELVIYVQSAIGTAMIAFGGLNWALDGAAAPVAAVLRLRAGDAARWRAAFGHRAPPPGCPRARSASAM